MAHFTKEDDFYRTDPEVSQDVRQVLCETIEHGTYRTKLEGGKFCFAFGPGVTQQEIEAVLRQVTDLTVPVVCEG